MTDHQSPCPRNMPSRVCTTHNLKQVKHLFKALNVFKSCAVCKCRSWPWTAIVKCKGCKMVGHRRCLRNDETLSRGCDEENHAAEEPAAVQSNSDDGAIEAQLNAATTFTATAAVVTIRLEENENTSEGARGHEMFGPPPNPSALPPLLSLLTPPYDPPSNITITDSAHFMNNIWYTVSTIKKTFEDGHVDEYHMITRTNFTDNVTMTVCMKIIENSMFCLASSSIRTCAI